MNRNKYEVRIVQDSKKTIPSLQIFLLWMGAGIGLASIFSGNALADLGFVNGMLVIIIGMLIGSIPMYFMSKMGTREGVSGMIATRAAFGIRGSFFPSLCNALQLLGWTAVMIITAADACVYLKLGGIFSSREFWIIVIGLLTTINAVMDHNNWKWFQVFTVGATLILSIVMTYAVIHTYNLHQILSVAPTGKMNVMLGLDFVIGMCLSWVPLVADYSREAKNEKGAAHSAFWGYAITSIWMYFVGLFCTIATGVFDASPVPVMVALGLGWVGLLVIIFSTVTTAFLDVYSAGISASNLTTLLSEKKLVLIVGILGTIISLFFPIDQYQNFLATIGAVFIPLESVVLIDYFIIKKKLVHEDLSKVGGKYWYMKGINWRAFFAFAVGFVIYEVGYIQGWVIGSSFISFIATAAVYYIVTKLMPYNETRAVQTA